MYTIYYTRYYTSVCTYCTLINVHIPTEESQFLQTFSNKNCIFNVFGTAVVRFMHVVQS